jgi:hypothetical protein
VTKPEAIDISETQADSTPLLQLRVAKEDLGRVIGKAGPNCAIDPHHPARSPRGEPSKSSCRNRGLAAARALSKGPLSPVR